MLLIVVVVVLLVLVLSVVLVSVVRSDGNGKLPPEPTHRPWTAGQFPSEPYSSADLP